jgi:hypothetical protein
MNISDLSVSIYSSTILESIASDVVPMIFNLDSFPNYFPDIAKIGMGIEIKTLEQAQNTIKSIISGEIDITTYHTKIELLRKEFFSYDKDDALSNIVREIEN